MAKKALIIGGFGFIGSQLAKDCINKGFEVTIFSRSDEKKENIKEIAGKIKIILKELKDIDSEVAGFDYIFNLAGSTNNYAIIEGQPYLDIEANCVSMIALLEAVKKHNPKARLVIASTFFVNGNVEKLPVNSDSPCNPLGLYGATRLAAEHFCHIYHNIFDLDAVIARFSNVYGPNEEGLDKKKAAFNYMIRQAVEGKEINVYNSGNFYRDYIYVTDVSSACIMLAEKGETNKIYYVGRGEFTKFKELIDIIVKYTKVKTNEVTPPDFHRRVGIKDFVCDNKNLVALGWKPLVSNEEGIKKTIDYYNKLVSEEKKGLNEKNGAKKEYLKKINPEENLLIEGVHSGVKKIFEGRKNGLVPGKDLIKTGYAVFDHRELNAMIDSVLTERLGLAQCGEEFEKKFAEYLECKYSVLTNSGSSASLLALAAIKEKLKLKGGEIITPACGFPTTINPIIQLGFKPVFVDIDETYNITPEGIKSALSKKTVGIVFAHTLGNPAKIEEVTEIAKKNNLFLIEDCSDAYGSLYNGKKCGSFGTVSVASFYPAHNITLAGEGGAVSTSDPEIYRLLRSLRDWGRDCLCKTNEDNKCGKRFDYVIDGVPYDHKYIFSTIGYNLKPVESQAAMGLEQFKKIEDFNKKRRENFESYKKKFSDLSKFFVLPKVYPNADPVFFGFPLMIADKRISRKEIVEFLNKNKIATRFLFAGNLTRQPAYKGTDFSVVGTLKKTDEVMNNLFWLGLHPAMGEKEIEYVRAKFDEFLQLHKLK